MGYAAHHLQQLLDAATRHAELDDPDHEVGDLQDALRVAYGLMTQEQRGAFFNDPAVAAVFEAGPGEADET